MVLKQNKKVLKWKGGVTCKYINKWGVEYKEHVGRPCEGLRGRRNWVKNHQGPSKTNHKKKGRTSDYDILGRVWIRKSQKGDKEYFF